VFGGIAAKHIGSSSGSGAQLWALQLPCGMRRGYAAHEVKPPQRVLSRVARCDARRVGEPTGSCLRRPPAGPGQPPEGGFVGSSPRLSAAGRAAIAARRILRRAQRVPPRRLTSCVWARLRRARRNKSLSRAKLWAFARTLANHRCWRYCRQQRWFAYVDGTNSFGVLIE
jgi:hypothetical protein